ncbi:MAG: DNA polymerase III subunit gamma/tau, partial [Bacteroidales bacterium]|nr:DNA polymerase III subunit gamma/tau [Bacteroidales bacterium]
MSYQVLARKWRPRSFDEMVGQEHVLKALVNGLDNDRLHHAYLFTGTRGVGKTTLARIIAKCLNCERGVSSSPCGECGACRAIAEGRFVDLLEVDAASRTKVEDTRDLLDNVQYLPTSGRYKVYLIDEVHMLSTHSFNALLKTLEEPPPHVKFLLATTDPQKLPVTVLSRCLQFNLKNLGPERIVSHLKFVLGEEKVPFEEEALWALGRAADGSMRDALSLTDQAISHGGGLITQAEVSAMLGTIDRAGVVEICEAVARADAVAALAAVQQLADHAPDYSEALGEMLSFWHRIAIAQTAPDALDHSHADHQQVLQLAAALDRETVQLLYQITLLGRRDLPHAADPRSGFEMVLMRLLAFHPVLPESLADQPMPGRPLSPQETPPAKKPEPAPLPAVPAGVPGVSSPATPSTAGATARAPAVRAVGAVGVEQQPAAALATPAQEYAAENVSRVPWEASPQQESTAPSAVGTDVDEAVPDKAVVDDA